MASITWRGFCEVAALSRYTSGFPFTRWLRIGKSSRIVAGMPIIVPPIRTTLAAVRQFRRTPRLRRDQHVVSVYLDRVCRDRPHGRQRQHTSGLYVEPGPVPRADDNVAGEAALAERRFLVRAGVVDREELAVHVGDRDHVPPRLDPDDRPRRDVRAA